MKNTNIKARKNAAKNERIKCQRDKWANDKGYQAKQQERLNALKSKPGYEKNIADGIKNKEANKLEKQERKKRVAELKRRKR